MAEEKLERIYTVPLGAAYEHTRKSRVPRAVKVLRQFVSKHMKVSLSGVYLSNRLNNSMWGRSIQHPPRKVKVRVIRKEDSARVYLPDEKTEDEARAEKERKDKEEKERAEKAKTEAAAKDAAAKKEQKEAKPPEKPKEKTAPREPQKSEKK